MGSGRPFEALGGGGDGALRDHAFPETSDQEPVRRVPAACRDSAGDRTQAGAGDIRRADERVGPEPDCGGAPLDQGHSGGADGDPFDPHLDGGAGDMREHHDDRGGPFGVHGFRGGV